MHLQSLIINNFRGIKSANIQFENTTVLVGENDSGKTSILDTLSIALSNTDPSQPVFEAQHFHRCQGDITLGPAGDILIELIFVELKSGEWDELDLNTLAALLPSDTRQLRQLHLRLTAPFTPDTPSMTANWTLFSPGQAKSENNAENLADLRQLNPIIWIRGSTVLGITGNNQCELNLDPPEDIAPLVKEIEHHYHTLITGGSQQTHDDIKAGYKAARTLLERRATNILSGGSLMHPLITDILGERHVTDNRILHTHHGSAALQTGVFLITAALLSYFSKTAVPGVRPKLLLEDPEANLHLMTLASVWGLLKHIKAQKLITTQSGTLLAATPLRNVTRLTRHQGVIKQWHVREDVFTNEELRKLSYHVRVRRGSASFARCWLLVEGETEFWILPELALLNGYDFNIEGVAVVEFAQCGLAPLIKLAKEWGIEWHVLTDGDKAGQSYFESASQHIDTKENTQTRITRLRQKDIEHCFWSCGYKEVFERVASGRSTRSRFASATSTINRAIKRHSKPYLAFELIQAAGSEQSPGTPKIIKQMIEVCIDLARNAPRRNTEL